MDKDKLEKALELIKARIFLEETDLLSLNEEDFNDEENINKIPRFYIWKGETQKALSFCKKFTSSIEDAVSYYLKKYVSNLAEPELDKKFYDFLERIIKVLDKKDKEKYLYMITQDLLQDSVISDCEPRELPHFIINSLMDENPNILIRLYLDYRLLDVKYF